MSNSHYIASFDKNTLIQIHGEYPVCQITGEKATEAHHIHKRMPEVLRKEIPVKERRKFYGSPLNCLMVCNKAHSKGDIHSTENRYEYLKLALAACKNYELKPNDYQFIEEMRIWFETKGLPDIYST